MAQTHGNIPEAAAIPESDFPVSTASRSTTESLLRVGRIPKTSSFSTEQGFVSLQRIAVS